MPEPSLLVRPWRRVVLTPHVFTMASRLLQWRSRRPVITTELSEHQHAVVSYNLGVTRAKARTRTRRAERYYHWLSTAPGRLLIIGPRDVHELLIAWCYGYPWSAIEAIDLYSTHPKIRVMDMESMVFADATFDAVAMSNTLAYASDTFAVLSEIARVLKPGGLCAFGSTHVLEPTTWCGNAFSGEDIEAMLKRLSFGVWHHIVTTKTNALGLHQASHDFLVRKADGSGA